MSRPFDLEADLDVSRSKGWTGSISIGVFDGNGRMLVLTIGVASGWPRSSAGSGRVLDDGQRRKPRKDGRLGDLHLGRLGSDRILLFRQHNASCGAEPVRRARRCRAKRCQPILLLRTGAESESGTGMRKSVTGNLVTELGAELGTGNEFELELGTGTDCGPASLLSTELGTGTDCGLITELGTGTDCGPASLLSTSVCRGRGIDGPRNT